MILPKHWTAASPHICSHFFFLFCFAFGPSQSDFFLIFTFCLLSFLFYITRNVSERPLCQLVKQNQLEMMRKSIHLPLRLARLDRLLDPPAHMHCSECQFLFGDPEKQINIIYERNKISPAVFICRCGLKTTEKKVLLICECNILEKCPSLPNQTNKHDIQYVGVRRPF